MGSRWYFASGQPHGARWARPRCLRYKAAVGESSGGKIAPRLDKKLIVTRLLDDDRQAPGIAARETACPPDAAGSFADVRLPCAVTWRTRGCIEVFGRRR